MRQLACAVAHLHKRRILHKDIKPGNVFITQDSQLKLGDFGISCVLSMNGFTSDSDGTPTYMAPERHNYRSYDYKADIWALGCLFYQMCAWLPPFRGEDLATRIIHGKPEAFPTKHYSEELQDVIDRMLEKKAKDRPAAAILVALIKANLNTSPAAGKQAH